ncbi:MAG: tRNA pseudouridine(38-40) synthase TruA [bacterium]
MPSEFPSQRYRMIVEYDGTDFHGWQLQNDLRTVQSEIERSLQRLFQREIRTYAAGRTDSGVHALGQVVHFDAEAKFAEETVRKALNSFLPVDVRIVSVLRAAPDFHARYSAKWRWYRYHIFHHPKAVERQYGWWIKHALNLTVLQRAASQLKGELDFASFVKIEREAVDDTKSSTLCRVYAAIWEQTDMELRFHIIANRFLRHMVRRLVGMMVEVARGRFTMEHFEDLLLNPRSDAGVLTAAAHGLCLMAVGFTDFSQPDQDDVALRQFPSG